LSSTVVNQIDVVSTGSNAVEEKLINVETVVTLSLIIAPVVVCIADGIIFLKFT
jgi:hypothetical protein